MKKVLIAGLALTLLAGCEQSQQGSSQTSAVGEHKVQSVVFNDQPIYFADGTGFRLTGEVLQETFAKVPDAQKRFGYQEGARRTIRVHFEEDIAAVIKSISGVMKEGGYEAKVNQPKEGLTAVNFVKKGYPSVNVRFTTEVLQSGQKKSQAIFNWII